MIALNAPTLQPERSKPFSHLITGVVLRACPAHPTHRHAVEAHRAGRLLLSHLFKKDNYPDRSSPEYWLRFTYPFWFTDLISATDSLSKLGFKKEEPGIAGAIQWFVAHQSSSGLWKLKTLKNLKKYQTDLWISIGHLSSTKAALCIEPPGTSAAKRLPPWPGAEVLLNSLDNVIQPVKNELCHRPLSAILAFRTERPGVPFGWFL